MNDLTFGEGAGKFMGDLVEKCGDDLIYSLAYEDGNLFLCVTAHEMLTDKEFNNGSMRVTFRIEHNELGILQDEMVDTLSSLVNDMIVTEDNDILRGLSNET
jgi:hypothetical protein